jgi:hypothetical protein
MIGKEVRQEATQPAPGGLSRLDRNSSSYYEIPFEESQPLINSTIPAPPGPSMLEEST